MNHSTRGLFTANRFLNLNLRTKFILTFLAVALVPLGLLAFLSHRTLQARLTDTAHQALLTAASQTATRLDAFINTNLDAIRTEAELPLWSNYLQASPEQRRTSGLESELRTTARALSHKPHASSYALLDTQGQTVMDTFASQIGLNKSDDEYFQRPLKTGLPYVSPVEFSPTTGKPSLYFSSPVRNSARNIVGVLRIRYDADVLQDIVAQNNNLAGSKSFAVLFDEHHVRLAHGLAPEIIFQAVAPLDPAQVTALQAARRLPDRPADELATHLAQLDQALTLAATHPFFTAAEAATGERPNQVAVAMLTARPWLVAFFQPQAVFLAPVQAQTGDALLLAALMALAVIAVAVGMGQLLSRPITRLTAVARQIAAGSLNAQASADSKDEIGLLAVTFNGMTAQLRRTIESLQHEIVERSQAEAAARQSQQALRESEARLRALLNAIPELVFRLRGDGVFVDYHAPSRDRLLVAPELFLGQQVQTVMPPDIADQIMQAIAQVLQTGQPAEFEYSLVAPEQAQHFEARMVASGPDEVLSTVRDITGRKQVEQQLQQRLSELATINVISQVAASELDLNVLIELATDKLSQQFDIQGVYIALHDPATDLVHFPCWRSLGEHLQVSPRRGGVTAIIMQTRQPLVINEDYERRFAELGGTRVLAPNSTLRPKSWLGVPMFARNEIIGVIAMQNYEREHAFTEADVRLLITIAANVGIAIQNAQLYAATQQELAERKKLIAELEAKNAELERFVYTVSHDLKSPLVTIRGFLGFVEKDAASGNAERLKADMRRITDATDKMQRLLNELLELSRIGRMMNPPKAVSFEAIAREAIELVQGRLAARGVQVEIALDLPIVHGDRARLIEVVQNLLDNAAKFMGDQSEPRIEIGTSGADADGKPILFVRDNGLGIEPQYHERIFGLFNKLDAQTEGTGVGLALVKRIVEVHGGRIWVESDGVGHGATFCFTLPPAPVETRPHRKE